ncbi:MAG: ribosome silencing factor [Tissierellia bacterium]|nr:ribosome silencing factor [Tissierellia bacterium]
MGDLNKKIEIIKKACEDKNGEDIVILDVSKQTTIAECFIIVSANSPLQMNAISDSVDEQMSNHGYEQLYREGQKSSGWMLLDYNDCIVHIFLKDEREYYDLERLWENMNN